MPEKPAEANNKQPLSVKLLLGDAADILETAVLTIFVFLMIFTFLLRPVTVDGSSMVPTLRDHDQLLILSPDRSPKNGQIIIVNDLEAGLFSDEAQTQVYRKAGLNIVIVKRVIARAGQTIDIDFTSGTVSVDGKVQDEPYIAEPTVRNDGAFTYPMTVPEGYVFVMGDNRGGSTDSRNPGVALVPAEQIIGTAIVRYGRDSELCSSWKDRFAYLF
ncbi:MAG: signal peptidase I [Oscillospiraceae bacterium]|nr:signal peptidase I [Oscillospiraceae bacterium]